MSTPPLALVVAAADNDVIGRDNALPWHLPADLQHFKRLTMGKPIIMGRRTYLSIGRPLPGRRNIVITGDRDFAAEGLHSVHSLDAARSLAADLAAARRRFRDHGDRRSAGLCCGPALRRPPVPDAGAPGA